MPILCRPYKPNTKGKVEINVRYVKENFYKGREFRSLDEINKSAKIWLANINKRIHQTTKQRPIDRLKMENLNSIENKKLYDTTEIYYRKVYKDIHFSFKGKYYSVPYKYAFKEVAIRLQEDKKMIVTYRNEIIAIHNLNINENEYYITLPEHMEPLKKIRMRSQYYQYLKKKPKKESRTNKINIISKYHSIDEDVQIRNLSYYEMEVQKWV